MGIDEGSLIFPMPMHPNAGPEFMCSSLQAAKCLPSLQCIAWHSLPKYTAALHREHGLRVTTPAASATPQLAEEGTFHQKATTSDLQLVIAGCYPLHFTYD
jgi:hypothetical protein